MDPLTRPEFLLLEQGDRALEDHIRLFLLLANLTSYPDDVLCSFYDASLNTSCRAPSSEHGPREDFAAFVEWTLVRNGSPFTVSSEDDLASSTQDPVPSPPSPRHAERMPEPTADGEPEPAATDELSPHGATEPQIATEPELLVTSVQVRELATTPPQGRVPGTVRARRGAPLPAPWLRVSLIKIWVKRKRRRIILTGILT